MFGFLKKIFGTAQDRLRSRYFKIARQVNEWDEKLKPLSDEEVRAKTGEFKERLKAGESLDDLLPEVYAVVKNVCRRMWGKEVHVSGYDQKWDMIPYDVQTVGAIALHKGTISEMMTGEGKTLTAAMPLYLNALTGKPVHLVTVNDYLAERDCEWVGSVFRWLGLTTGAITNNTPMEKRKEVYEKDIVYGTASEFGFDYLRDNSMAMGKSQQVQRGYYFAIIDEVDSILIDEARTPLIISGPVPDGRQMYDELKAGVSELVKRQRDWCSKFAVEAKKELDPLEGKEQLSKEEKEKERAALKTLWLVSKGTPRNKTLKRVKEDPDRRAGLDEWDLYFYSDQNKEEKAQNLAELYMVVDERSNEYELTDKGIHTWSKSLQQEESADDFVMLDISHEYLLIDEDSSLSDEEKIEKKLKVQEEDAKRKERAHNLRQMLRAHLLMERDIDYIIQDGKVVIVDENTGRPQPGRRFADGLHQAIEAKEGLAIQKETQTYATITLQNYFRMYDKIAGMTGTAMTEAQEFMQIYKLDVMEIPTHRKCVRDDANDEIYMTEREKYNAMLKDVTEEHRKGRPILIGTDSVEVSEKLSRIFRQNNLPHTVLNAKQHVSEAEVIANAGQKGAITIATNMAGRGTDIKLAEGIPSIGGLYVIGTTRHQSRRIDRQLRGRCARQGDPGKSQFYISFEDSLLRLFASPRITALLQRFRPPEGEPISAKMLNKSIETAQKRVEQRNYMMRKHTLEYDDVMNKQRQEIYAFRKNLLTGEDIAPIAEDIIRGVCQVAAEKYFQSHSEEGGWDPEGYRQWLIHNFPVSFEEGAFEEDHLEIEDIEEKASSKVIEAFHKKIEEENSHFKQEDSEFESPANMAVRNLMIQKLDQHWQEHLLAMDHLRSDVNLRAVGQRDPLMEFKHEAFALFDALGNKLREQISHDLFRFQIRLRQDLEIERILSRLQMETDRSLVSEFDESQPQKPAEEVKPTPITKEPTAGRNDPCPCGSGRKYKKCCGQKLYQEI